MNNRLKIFLLLACMIAAVASTVYALPTGGRDITYYADDTYGDPVGGRYLACGSGQWSTWGTRTNFYIVETWDCGGGFVTDCSVYACNGYRWYDQYGGEHWEEGACTRVGCNDW
ncbi:MAG TPA: hypothetical protein VM733_03720 [Thermoanaerobaculia bacterium]|nr:hypothetical protein [Thermoanaerobaculia bacterium]